MGFSLPLQTQGLVVEQPLSGFKMMPVILDDMRPDEVLVEMKYSGICHTDIGGSTGGYSALGYPAVLGHEGAGIICAVGSGVRDTSLKPGQYVILSFNHCGECRNCTSRHPACCANFEALNVEGRRLDHSTPAKLLDGRRVTSQFFGQSSFLEYAVVSQYSAIPVPVADDDELAIYAALGCGFQTGAGTVLNGIRPNVNDSVAVIGVGTVGMAAIMAASYLGLETIIAVDIVDDKLTMAREMGATHVVNSKTSPDYVIEIQKISGGGVRFLLECTGVSQVLDRMLDSVYCGGTAVVLGSPKPEFVLKIDPEKLLHENKTLRGICQGDSVSKEFIPEMIRLHKMGVFPLEKLCTFYPIQDFDKAIEDVKSGRIIKPIVKWS